MYVGTALFLIAVGAILWWAVIVRVAGFDIRTAGSIILIIGLVGLVIARAPSQLPTSGPVMRSQLVK